MEMKYQNHITECITVVEVIYNELSFAKGNIINWHLPFAKA